MFSKVTGGTVIGIDGALIGVEADINDGLPMLNLVGYLSSSVKEAGERVRTALKNSGFFLPSKRITINLSPADIRKYGSGFDLPIAISIVLSMGIIPNIDLTKTIIIGELGLDGRVSFVNGVLPMVYHAFENGIDTCIVPYENINEAGLIEGMKVFGVKNLTEAIEFIQGNLKLEAYKNTECSLSNTFPDYNCDFSEIKGQKILKRGMEIAASGFHNVLMTGAAGAGKSMLAKRLPTIMPMLSFEESIEVTKIYSISGMLDKKGRLITERPFRAPHHTISNHALIGGGSIPKPGEVTLSHNGILFLDELPEFNKNVLEVLRQPLEDKKIIISRVQAAYAFPADFMLVAAMNPCPCGNYPNLNKCTCTPYQIKRYQQKISGPLLDRIDINMSVKPVLYDDIFSDSVEECSKVIRERVVETRQIQNKRYREESISLNSELDGRLIKKYIKLDNEVEDYLKKCISNKDISARGISRILRLSRTIADMEKCDRIGKEHLKEALFYHNTLGVFGKAGELYEG
ncbi:MAG: YifB family Mg chelatase-like AAA ATPase [Lachnospiraceae bacterium]|nr:YifB family Mg chelatase-like AAA ATPase [Lachnospiraceae bacterium]